MEGPVRVRVLREVEEIKALRPVWSSWQRHFNADIDFYLTVLGSRSEALRPHIIVLYRNRHPEAMLIGRLERKRLDFRIGYGSFFRPFSRLLMFAYGGLLGNPSSENCRVLVGEILNSLRQGEADIAFLNHLPVDSSIYSWATRLPGFLSRDHSPMAQMHWSMVLPGSGEDFYRNLDGDKRRQARRREERLLQDCSGNVRFNCVRDSADLESMIQDVEDVARKTYQRGLGVGFVNSPETRQRLYLEAQKGWLRTYLLYAADRPCAFWSGTVYKGTFYSGDVGYDPAYKKYAPGTMILMKVFENLCEEKVKVFDFGLGDAPWKQVYGHRRWEEASVYIFAPTLKGFLLNALRTTMVLVEQSAKKVLDWVNLLPRVKKLWRDRVREE